MYTNFEERAGTLLFSFPAPPALSPHSLFALVPLPRSTSRRLSNFVDIISFAARAPQTVLVAAIDAKLCAHRRRPCDANSSCVNSSRPTKITTLQPRSRFNECRHTLSKKSCSLFSGPWHAGGIACVTCARLRIPAGHRTAPSPDHGFQGPGGEVRHSEEIKG